MGTHSSYNFYTKLLDNTLFFPQVTRYASPTFFRLHSPLWETKAYSQPGFSPLKIYFGNYFRFVLLNRNMALGIRARGGRVWGSSPVRFGHSAQWALPVKGGGRPCRTLLMPEADWVDIALGSLCERYGFRQYDCKGKCSFWAQQMYFCLEAILSFRKKIGVILFY